MQAESAFFFLVLDFSVLPFLSTNCFGVCGRRPFGCSQARGTPFRLAPGRSLGFCFCFSSLSIVVCLLCISGFCEHPRRNPPTLGPRKRVFFSREKNLISRGLRREGIYWGDSNKGGDMRWKRRALDGGGNENLGGMNFWNWDLGGEKLLVQRMVLLFY